MGYRQLVIPDRVRLDSRIRPVVHGSDDLGRDPDDDGAGGGMTVLAKTAAFIPTMEPAPLVEPS